MTRVDFHFNAPDKLQYACRLVRKIVRSAHRAVVFSSEADALARFDELLWTFSRGDFIPHVDCADPLAPVTPVLLAAGDDEPLHHDVVVNIGTGQPPWFGRFDRLVEVVGADEHDRGAARERWRFYRDRGYPMTRHDLSGGRHD